MQCMIDSQQRDLCLPPVADSTPSIMHFCHFTVLQRTSEVLYSLLLHAAILERTLLKLP